MAPLTSVASLRLRLPLPLLPACLWQRRPSRPSNVRAVCTAHAEAQTSTGTNWVLPTGTPTGILVRNSFTKQKEPLVLATPGLVNWYQCGPTVYAATHIGHACTYVRFDIIRRLLTDHFKYVPHTASSAPRRVCMPVRADARPSCHRHRALCQHQCARGNRAYIHVWKRV